MMQKRFMLLMLTCILATGLVNQAVFAADEIRMLEWEELIPEGYDPDQVVMQYEEKYNLSELPDSSPVLKELMTKINELRSLSPANTALDGQRVKLPGYVVPLETDGQKTSEFLLVPYFGACIHVPPPPSNQTVHVTMPDNETAAIRKLFDTVWVTGVLRVEQVSSDLADAGYILEASRVEPYE